MLLIPVLLAIQSAAHGLEPGVRYESFALVLSADFEASGAGTDLIRALNAAGLKIVAAQEAAEEELSLRSDTALAAPMTPLEGVILVESDSRHKDRDLIVTLIDYRTATRLALLKLKHETPAAAIAGRITSALVDVRKRYPRGVEQSIVVSAPTRAGVGARLEQIQAAVAHALYDGFDTATGVGLTETESAWAIQRELTGLKHDVAARRATLAIAAEIRQDRGAGADGRYRLTLEIVNSKETRKVERVGASARELAEYVRTEFAPGILSNDLQAPLTTLSPETQSKFLVERADACAKHGLDWQEIWNREQALTIQPGDLNQMVALCSAYLRLVPYEDTLDWDHWDPIEMMKDWRRRGFCWRRAAELIANADLSQNNAVFRVNDVISQLDGAIRNFVFYTPSADDDLESPERQATLAILDNEMQLCTAAHRKLIQNLGKRRFLARLEIAKKRGIPGSERFDLNAHLEWAAGWPTHSIRKKPAYGLDTSLKVLRRLQDATEALAADLNFCPRHLVMAISEIPFEPESRFGISDGDWREFLDGLVVSRVPILQAYGRLGAILTDFSRGRSGKKTAVKETLASLDKWAAETNALAADKYEANTLVRRLKQKIDPPAFPELPIAETTTRPDSIDRLPLDFERVRVVVHRLDGTVWPFTPSPVKGAPSWGPIGKIPVGIIRDGRLPVWLNERAVLIERKPCEVSEISFDESARNMTAAVENERIWVLSSEPRLRVWGFDGRLIAEADGADGLPSPGGGCRMLEYEPGKMLAVGTSGLPRRSWCAALILDGNKVKIDVFHEATRVPDRSPQRRPSNAEQETEVGFPIHNLMEQRESDGIVGIVEPEAGSRIGLRVNPRTRKVDTVYLPLSEFRSHNGPRSFRVAENGNWYLAYTDAVRTAPAPTTQPARPDDAKKLWSSEFGYCSGLLLPCKGKFIAPGHVWLRIDPATNLVEEFQKDNLKKIDRWTNDTLGYSRLSGILLFCNNGEVFRAVMDGSATPNPGMPETAPSAAEKRLIESAAPVVAAIRAFKRDRGLWPSSLDDLVPDFLANPVHSGLIYEWKPRGPNLLHVQGVDRSRQPDHEDIIHVFGGTEPGIYSLKGNSARLLQLDHTPPMRMELSSDRAAVVLRELDRRIRNDPVVEATHSAKVTILYLQKRYDEARAATVDWINAMPTCLQARTVLRDVEIRKRSGHLLNESHYYRRKAMRGPHKTLGDACVYAIRGSGPEEDRVFEAGKSLPMPSDAGELFLVEDSVLSRAHSCYLSSYDAKVVDACDFWEEKAKEAGRDFDPAFLILRAAALARLGEFDRAEKDAERIEDNSGRPTLIPIDPTRLLEAIDNQDRSFKYQHYEMLPPYSDWPLWIE